MLVRQHEREGPGQGRYGRAVVSGEAQPPAEFTESPGVRMGEGDEPGSVDGGDQVRRAACDPRRLGARRGHRDQAQVLARPDGDRHGLVQRPGSVVTASGGEHAGHGQDADLGDRRYVRVPRDVGDVPLRRSVLALLGQRAGEPSRHVQPPGVEVAVGAIRDARV